MKCLELPINVYQLKCGDCGTHYDFPEAAEYERLLNEVHKVEALLKKEKAQLQSQLHFLERATFEGSDQVIGKALARLNEIDASLLKNQQGRLFIKRLIQFANNYIGEGRYFCVVSNTRGGSMKITRCSEIAWIIIERPSRMSVKMLPFYVPRRRVMRRRWSMYKSILGTFLYGELIGIVRIRFDDDAVYEGPYVEEKHVDATGRVSGGARSAHHYGYYTCPDGRVFEGESVDNHFSPSDLNGVYKLTVPDEFTYEGEWCDEKMHGAGVCSYASGDSYQGEWFLNQRFGTGQYKSAEGWVYEGEFNRNQRHGDGAMRSADGGSYIGSWVRDKRSGKGTLLTRILDLYQGEFFNDQICGLGEMFYGNGNRYVGSFDRNLRHGKGQLIEKDGCEYHGEFANDSKEGEFVVKYMLNRRAEGLEEFEVRIGSFKDGKLVEWKRVINRKTTDNFVSLFYENRSNFDGVYSLILAKSLPSLPLGLDPSNRDVRLIIDRIRAEGGSLVSDEPLQRALDAVKSILKPIRLLLNARMLNNVICIVGRPKMR